MRLRKKSSLGWSLVLIGLVAVVGTAIGVRAPLPEIEINVADVSAYPGEQVEIPVYLSNYMDTIAGFNFWVQLDRPDIMEFTTVLGEYYDISWWQCTAWSGPDCLDSIEVGLGDAYDFYHVDTSVEEIGTLDSTGTLVSGWEWLGSRSLSGLGTDLNVAGLADLPPQPITPGIAPQQDGLFIKLVGQVYDIPDTMTERTVNIMLQTVFLDHFSFSDPQGNSIGIVCDTVPDTNYWRCTAWAGEICLNWQQVSGPPYDSMSIDGYDIICHVDTSVVYVSDGSVTVLPPSPIIYGDANCSGSTDISDLVYVVDYMFLGGPPSPCEENFDCDEDNLITITDLICLVDWMFPPH